MEATEEVEDVGVVVGEGEVADEVVADSKAEVEVGEAEGMEVRAGEVTKVEEEGVTMVDTVERRNMNRVITMTMGTSMNTTMSTTTTMSMDTKVSDT